MSSSATPPADDLATLNACLRAVPPTRGKIGYAEGGPVTYALGRLGAARLAVGCALAMHDDGDLGRVSDALQRCTKADLVNIIAALSDMTRDGVSRARLMRAALRLVGQADGDVK